ncbi:tripartite tricarboxylate transporter TctB family protein [Sinorhizobium psoraleae]|uniref:Tripartite tricarboxylate transporter TctB family protein n=1 Tax=Sinorhizobium psoraleae TaxID=520838 RepID=A0ABT4KSL1_9HYPH|nr:tripartite tricarboxylate transporter TctB family protein [Sinorhizobium psoraleae]MCZ4094276.1 tripartite tricarboxylate transporter TctB family protein [Sinorhizobium psoraleae]
MTRREHICLSAARLIRRARTLQHFELLHVLSLNRVGFEEIRRRRERGSTAPEQNGDTMKSISFDTTNALCGGILTAVGLFFVWQSLTPRARYRFPHGPGLFPAPARLRVDAARRHHPCAVRTGSRRTDGGDRRPRHVFILPAPIFFGLTVRGLGFVPAIFFTALIACFASHRMKPHWALAISLALTVFSVAVFSYGLNLPFERFGPWVRF